MSEFDFERFTVVNQAISDASAIVELGLVKGVANELWGIDSPSSPMPELGTEVMKMAYAKSIAGEEAWGESNPLSLLMQNVMSEVSDPNEEGYEDDMSILSAAFDKSLSRVMAGFFAEKAEYYIKVAEMREATITELLRNPQTRHGYVRDVCILEYGNSYTFLKERVELLTETRLDMSIFDALKEAMGEFREREIREERPFADEYTVNESVEYAQAEVDRAFSETGEDMTEEESAPIRDIKAETMNISITIEKIEEWVRQMRFIFTDPAECFSERTVQFVRSLYLRVSGPEAIESLDRFESTVHMLRTLGTTAIQDSEL